MHFERAGGSKPMSADIGSYVSEDNIGFLLGDLNMSSLAAQHRLTSFLAWQQWLAREAMSVYRYSLYTGSDIGRCEPNIGPCRPVGLNQSWAVLRLEQALLSLKWLFKGSLHNKEIKL